MNSPVLVGSAPPAASATPLDRAWQRAAPVFAALGLAITAVAALDLGLAWVPAQFGNPEWEFGTVTRTFDSLALGTTGLGWLLIWSVVRKVRWALVALGLVFVLLLVGIVGGLVLYWLNVPVALGAVPAEAGTMLKRSVARSSVFGTTYLALYAWLSWFTWRAWRAEARGESR